MSKIPCGGFEFDDSLEIRDGKLSAKSALDALSGGSMFVVTFSVDESGETFTADKTYEEIASANEKKMVFGRLSLDGAVTWLPIAGCDENNGAIFTNITKQGTGWLPSMLTLRVKANNTVEFEMTDLVIK